MFESFSLIVAAAAQPDAGGGPVEAISQGFGLDGPFFLGQLVNFLIVAALLYFLAFRPVLRAVDERQKKIAEGVRYADEMEAKLTDAEKQHEKTLREASRKASEIIKEAKTQAEELLTRHSDAARQQAEQILQRGEATIEAERKKMLEEVRSEVSRLVVKTTSRVLDRELSEEERSKFAESAAKELTTGR